MVVRAGFRARARVRIGLFLRRDGFGRAAPSLRRADFRNERGANLSEAPPASTPLGGSEAKRIGRIFVYLQLQPNRNVFPVQVNFPVACKIFSSSRHTSAGRGEATDTTG